MKHHLREEKICLNCGTEVTDRFCPHCGQENIHPKESFGHLVNHFFADITHYDSKFFITIKDLLLKPGFLTKEYIAGRRARYLNPVRMYVFISFVFFLAYFSFGSFQINVATPQQSKIAREKRANELRAEIDSDKVHPQPFQEVKDSILASTAARLDTANKNNDTNDILASNNMPSSVKKYDSIQQSLPPEKRDGRVARFLIRHSIAAVNKYHERLKEVLWEKFEHNLPKMMFLLLPFFALLLKLFYSWKKYYYVDHAIFSIHFHAFAFLILLVVLIFEWLFKQFSIAGWSFLIIFLYLVLALRNAYHQSFIKSFFKAIFIGIFYSIAIGLCLAIVGLFTFLSI